MFYEQGARLGAEPGAAARVRLPGRHARPREDGGVRPHRRRRALGADAPGVSRADAQPLRRRRRAAGAHPGRARVLRPARPQDAPRRRAALQRRRGDGRERRRLRGAVRHRQHLPVEGPRGAGRLGARDGRRDAAGGGARPQGAGRGHAPGRRHRRRRAVRAAPQRRAPGRRSPPRAPPGGGAGRAAGAGRRPRQRADEHGVRRHPGDGRAGRRAGRASRRGGRALPRRGAVVGALRHPSRRGRRRRRGRRHRGRQGAGRGREPDVRPEAPPTRRPTAPSATTWRRARDGVHCPRVCHPGG